MDKSTKGIISFISIGIVLLFFGSGYMFYHYLNGNPKMWGDSTSGEVSLALLLLGILFSALLGSNIIDIKRNK